MVSCPSRWGRPPAACRRWRPSSALAAGALLADPQGEDIPEGIRRRQKADRHLLPRHAAYRGDSQEGLLAPLLPRRPAEAALGGRQRRHRIEPGQHLELIGQPRPGGDIQAQRLDHPPIDAQPDPQALLVGIQVDIAGPGTQGILEQGMGLQPLLLGGRLEQRQQGRQQVRGGVSRRQVAHGIGILVAGPSAGGPSQPRRDAPPCPGLSRPPPAGRHWRPPRANWPAWPAPPPGAGSPSRRRAPGPGRCRARRA